MILFKGRERDILIFYTVAIILSLLLGVWAYSYHVKAVEGGERASTAGYFFLWLVVFTLIFLALIKLFPDYVRLVFFVLELFFLFVTTSFIFSLANGAAALSWALLLVSLRALFPENLFLRNLSVAIIGGVSAGLVGASLFLPVSLLFYIILILYDFVSVFITGHMVELARGIEKGIGRGDFLALGGGDLVLPAIFAVSALQVGLPSGIASAIGAVIGVIFAFYCLKKFRRPLPALPYIGAVQISLTALTLFLSTLLP